MDPLGIAIVGSGNVAAHLAHALAGHVAVVASRNTDHARALADAAGIPAACGLADLASLAPKAVIFSLADHAMAHAVAAVGALPGQPVVMHTSGTLPMQTLAPVCPRYGVLYPLQTFSRNVGVDFRRIPVFTEGADAATLAVIDGLASLLSGTVRHADARQRGVLHIAGVFSSNFTNALLEIVQGILAAEGYPLDTVQPLVEATVAKAFACGPHAAQTGPAVRGDADVMGRHLEKLSGLPRDIYALLSDYIINSHKNE